MGFTEIAQLREVTHLDVAGWRDALKERPAPLGDGDKKLSNATINKKLSALSSLFVFLHRENAVTKNPVKDVGRPPNPYANALFLLERVN